MADDKKKKKRFNPRQYDLAHLQAQYDRAKAIEAKYNEVIAEAQRIAESTGFNDAEKEFRFEDYPSAQKRMDDLMSDMSDYLTTTIEEGDKDEWQRSTLKNDAMVDYITANTTLSAPQLSAWKQSNLMALAAFQQRKIEGMSLSKRVWNLTDQLRQELELALDLGLGEGKSAAALSRDVRQYLNEPNRLFRRVRDKHGVLRLSKAAKAYHPGRGVYRSSYKNALRLTATENNMAYRTADHLRWQQMPFVIGIEIKLSNNHTCKGVIGRFVDICDDLAGVYPKEFKFVGWHPHCRCFAIAKMASDKECNDYFDRLEAGEDVSNYQFSGKVKELPQKFQNWYTDNADRIAGAKSQPYFLRDNAKLIEKNVPITKYGHKADKANAFNSKSYGSNVPANLNTLQQKDWISNEHDIENVLGIQGEPMTHEQANGNMPNPNYKVGIRDEYSINCQSCVVAYELRRRGYDVETLGRIFGDENNIPNKLAFHTELAWKDFDGKTPISKIAGGKNKTIENLKEEFNQHTLEIGRYHIKWEYARGNFAHIVTFERFSNGESIIYDAQTGALLQLEKIIKGANINNGIKILRVDNLLVNNDIINKVVRLKKS